jgi:hypothetical protein
VSTKDVQTGNNFFPTFLNSPRYVNLGGTPDETKGGHLGNGSNSQVINMYKGKSDLPVPQPVQVYLAHNALHKIVPLCSLIG